MKHRRKQHDLAQRILRVLTGGTASGEERLQGLRGQLDDPVAVDPPDPAALQRMSDGMKHA